MTIWLKSRFASLALVAIIGLFWLSDGLALQTSKYASGWTASGVDWTPQPSNAEPLGPPDSNCVGTTNAPTVFAQFSFSSFGIPVGDTVVGIEVKVNYGTVLATELRLYLSGSPVGSTRALGSTPQSSTCNASVIRTAGGSTDVWGTSLTAADFNSAGAVQVRLTRTTAGPDNPVSIDIESIQLVVHHQGANSPPNAVCQNVSKSANASCQAAVSASEVNNGSTDPDGDPLTFSLSPSGPFNKGVTNVTLTVDDSLATDTCPATVTVNDNSVPVITLAGNAAPTIECGSTFVDPGATVADNCDSLSVTVGGDTVDPDAPGTYIITYDAVDSSGNNAGQKIRTVTVEDTTPPEIALAGGDEILECAVDTFVDPGSSASDSCDLSVPVTVGGDIVDDTTPGIYVITYDAVDDSGNAAIQKSRTVTVEDTIAPLITLNGDAQITLECAVDSYVEPGATAADLCDPDVSVTVGGDVVDAGTPGTYVVTYDAVDDSGNIAAQVTRTVIVEDTIAPEIQCNAPATIIPPNAPISFTASATDLCAGDVASTISAFDCYFFNGSGKRVDKTGSCEVEFAGDTVTILDSGGVKDNIEWTVNADDGNGNSNTETCELLVVNPGKKKNSANKDGLGKRLDFAQFATGDGFSSLLILQNPSDTWTARGVVEFLDASGHSPEIGPRLDSREAERWNPVDSWTEFSIPPLGGVTLVSPGKNSIRDGSLSVWSDIELSGAVRYSIEGLGTVTYAGAEPSASLIAFVSLGEQTNTSLAVRNSESSEINVTFSLKNEYGLETEGGFASMRIGGGARVAVFMNQLFPQADLEDFEGEVVIHSDNGTLTAVAIEFGSGPGQLSTLPVSRLEKE